MLDVKQMLISDQMAAWAAVCNAFHSDLTFKVEVINSADHSHPSHIIWHVQSTGADSNFLSARTQVLPSSNLPAVLAIAYTAFHNLMQPETYQQYSAKALKPLK
jgi:hypothetical protein